MVARVSPSVRRRGCLLVHTGGRDSLPRKDDLKRLIEEELERNKSDLGWKGSGVKISSTQFSLTGDLRRQVQDVGKAHGCHTCLTVVNVDPDQPWIGDHVPPTNFPRKVIDNLLWPDQVVKLRPQCDTCSNEQANLVRKIVRTKKLTGLTDKELKLVGCQTFVADFAILPLAKGAFVPSSGPTVSASEGIAVQTLGLKHGCLTCGESFPRTVYHADHAFPQEFCTSYMEDLFGHLGLTYPTDFELRPQCPRCSGHQGGKMKAVADEAIAYCRDVLQIPVYK